MNIALFFGSFNPIHVGHLIMADEILNVKKLDELWFIVSPQNPQKNSTELAPENIRLQWVEKSITDTRKFKVSDVEFYLPKPSYTFQTIQYLIQEYPSYSFFLLLGQDNWLFFNTWKNYTIILNSIQKLYVLPRITGKDNSSQIEEHILDKTEHVNVPIVQISSTSIRKKIKQQQSIQYLIPDKLKEEIVKHYLNNHE